MIVKLINKHKLLFISVLAFISSLILAIIDVPFKNLLVIFFGTILLIHILILFVQIKNKQLNDFVRWLMFTFWVIGLVLIVLNLPLKLSALILASVLYVIWSFREGYTGLLSKL